MAIIQLKNVYKQFSGEYILNKISFSIENRDKIGLVGLNGAGKSTLIRILLGLETHDQNEYNEFGEITKSPDLRIGYLSQEYNFSDEKNTVYEEMLSVFHDEMELWRKIQKTNMKLSVAEPAELEGLLEELERLNSEYEAKDAYTLEYKIKQILTGLELGTEYYDRMLEKLSGGERARVSLAKLLLQEPELLILDEPTNHLDLYSIEWLEDFLKKYNKAFLLVSHDRYFLDNVCNKMFELENKKLYKYDGNFSDFIIQKELILKGEMKRYDKEQEKIKKTEEYIARYKAGIKSKQARGRQKILDRLERMDDPVFNPGRMKLKFEILSATGDNVLKVKNIEKSYNGKKVLNNISFDLYKGDRVGIIGKNGIGKSTLLKIITGNEKQDNGTVEFGSRVKTGYYDQNHQNLDYRNDIITELNTRLDLTEEYLRNMAGGFLFTGEETSKKIENLSGGEKVRVSFMKLIMEKPNFLILDEPTNHLDIYSIEVLEDSLEDYEGTMLIVSHDRHFLDSICNKIYYLDENGLEVFDGNYEDYKEGIAGKAVKDSADKQEKKLTYEEQKERGRQVSRLKNALTKLEKEIEEIELEKENLADEYDKAGRKNDIGLLMEIQEKIGILEQQETDKMDEWEKINLELEENEREQF